MVQNGKFFIWMIVFLLIGGAVGYSIGMNNPRFQESATDRETVAGTNISEKRLQLYLDMRHLWSDHVIWTRQYIIASVDGQPGAQEAAARLLKNQEDIGKAIGVYYGSNAGERVTTLLKDHINIAVEIVSAAKAKDQLKLADAQARWQKNAEDIAEYLSSANPNWLRQDLLDLLNMHLETTSAELTARLNKDYDADVEAFDNVFLHSETMADTLSTGIIAQFPAQF